MHSTASQREQVALLTPNRYNQGITTNKGSKFMTYKTTQQIRAHVRTDWSHSNCKFQPGDYAEVTAQVLPRQYVKMDGGIGDGHSYVSKKKQTRVAQIGRVRAVSCLPDGRIRSNRYKYPHNTRMFTRYYIQFNDGEILGYDSHHLRPAFSLKSLTEA
jgi:hypothetical protein